MEFVVDANILVAGFLRPALTRELLLDERLILYAPEYSLIETSQVLTRAHIRKKLGNLSPKEVLLILSAITERIQVLHSGSYESKLAQARIIAPDLADVPYLAVALHLRVPLWSNDTALKDQRSIPVYTTEELLELL
ncbi:MAG: PIN domain-containing protein [Candidatus Omnitrophota bacterium]|nr:PIN domain-containing protein [Candidatus Omnitrophota bacterium]